MSKQQTAVQWIIDWMSKNQYFIGNDLLQAANQARTMEKGQIETAYNAGREFGCKHDDSETGEDYYNLNYTENEQKHDSR